MLHNGFTWFFCGLLFGLVGGAFLLSVLAKGSDICFADLSPLTEDPYFLAALNVLEFLINITMAKQGFVFMWDITYVLSELWHDPPLSTRERDESGKEQ
jgi:hypothetical protein